MRMNVTNINKDWKIKLPMLDKHLGSMGLDAVK